MGERINLEDYMRMSISEGPIRDIRKKSDGSLLWESTDPHTMEGNGSLTFTGNRLHKLGQAVFEGESIQPPMPSWNLLNPAEVPNENKYVSAADGTLRTPSVDFRHSDYISVSEGVVYKFSHTYASSTSAGMAWYDESKAYISGRTLAQVRDADGLLTAPTGAMYCRLSWRIDSGYDTDWQNTVCFYDHTDGDKPYAPFGQITVPTPDTPLPIFSNNSKWGGPFWNQQISNGNFETKTGWSSILSSFSVNENNAIILASGEGGRLVKTTIGSVDDHRILVTAQIKTTSNSVYLGYGSGTVTRCTGSGSYEQVSYITTRNNSAKLNPSIIDKRTSGWDDIYVKNFMQFDLTQLFGSGNEPSTVEEFRAWAAARGKDLSTYQPYDLGTPIGGYVDLGDGWNLWDEEWEVGGYSGSTGEKYIPSLNDRIRCANKIPVIPNQAYYAARLGAGHYLRVHEYGSNGNWLRFLGNQTNKVFTTSSDCHYIAFDLDEMTVPYDHSICINLSQPDNSKYPYNGVYRSYIKPVSGLNRIGTAVDTYDAQSGLLTRGIGVVDLGTLNWGYNSTSKRFSTGNIVDYKYTSSYSDSAICTRYTFNSDIVHHDDGTGITVLCGLGFWKAGLHARDNRYSDAASFKASLAGTLLYYELATPTTETITPQPITQYRGQNNLTQIDGDIPNTKLTIEYYNL